MPSFFILWRRSELLAALMQATIWLENATLYNKLVYKMSESTMKIEDGIKERKVTEEAAQSVNQAKNTFLANISHELRTLLNAILGYARILKRQDASKKQAEIIEQSGQHLLTRINDLLDLAKIESEKLEIPPSVVDPVERRIMGIKTKAGTTLPEALSVLVVDDRWQSRAILADLLSSVGFSVYEAADGQEGVNKALELHPQVVLTDLQMPVLSGIELIRQLRASALKDVVIIAFSASAFSENKRKTSAAGSNAFLPKPINPAQLFATLQEHLPICWIYEDLPELREASTGEKTSPSSSSSSLSTDYQPSTEQISQLLRCAQIGDIQALTRQSEQLLAQEPAAHAFVTELQQFAKAFKMRQLRKMLKSLLDESA